MRFAPTKKTEGMFLAALSLGGLGLVYAGIISTRVWFALFIILGAVVHLVFKRLRGPQTFLQESLENLDLTTLNLSQQKTDRSSRSV